MRFVTITTENYALNAVRLVRSIRRVHADAEILVYSECPRLQSRFQALGAELILLPEIDELGVKRAKFAAYSDAARRGGFVYLDADVIVLQSLDILGSVTEFTACRDDLSECGFISDPMRPWGNFPDVSGDRYFNSGVFAVPSGLDWFFDKIRSESRDDLDWNGVVIPGRLYDNHYLCLKVFENDIPLAFIPESSYNWQGFRRFGALNCFVDDKGDLCNKSDGGLLHLIHFAGVRDIDACIAALPFDVAAIVAQSIGGGEVGVLELLNSALRFGGGLDAKSKMALVGAITTSPGRGVYSPGADISLLSNPRVVSSIVHSTCETDFLWNGLKCGAAYLSVEEYVALRTFVRRNCVEGVLEFGAGYTTVLFRRLVKKQFAIEGWDGPWLQYALENGCTAHRADFSPAVGFDDGVVAEAVESVLSGEGRGLVFVDSPPGTANRAVVIDQVIAHAHSADFYVVHDSVRDAENVYRLAAALDLRVVNHFSSFRGMTFLARGSLAVVDDGDALCLDKRYASHIRFAVRLEQLKVGIEGSRRILVNLANVADTTIPCGSGGGLLFSLHLLGVNGETLGWDTPRYSLPVSLEPGDNISFWMEVPAIYSNAVAAACDFVKEGEFWWSELEGCLAPKIEFGD